MFPSETTGRPVLDWFASGSRVIVNPPPTDTDEDWAVLVTGIEETIPFLEKLGFKMEGNSKDYANDEFRSFRRGDLNLIVMWDKDTYTRFRMATEVAKALNLSVKSDRVKLFQTIRDVGRKDGTITQRFLGGYDHSSLRGRDGGYF